MSQQLNLYDPALKPKRDWLSLGNVVLAALGVLVLLLLLGSWGRHAEGQALARLNQQDAQLKGTQAQLVELASLQAKRRPDPALEKQIADRNLLLKQKNEVLALLEGGAVGQVEGFAADMEALARRVPEGLWLQGFDLRTGGHAMVLQGGLISEPLLPLLVQGLNQEARFKGRHFAALQVTPVAPLAAPAQGEDGRSFLERSGYLRFSLEGVGLERTDSAGSAP